MCIWIRNASIDDEFKSKGYELGSKLAELGHKVVFGEGANGMMGAVATGVVENNGKVLGILPYWMDDFDQIFTECEDIIYTKDMDERKELFLNHAPYFLFFRVCKIFSLIF